MLMSLGFFQIQKGRHHATPRVDDVEKMRVRVCMYVCMYNHQWVGSDEIMCNVYM